MKPFDEATLRKQKVPRVVPNALVILLAVAALMWLATACANIFISYYTGV